MQIIKDILGFMRSLKGLDILLYIAILVLIILIVSLIYIIKTSDEEEILEDSEDLKSIVNTIEKNELPTIELTEYEAEQEEKAIISYEELLEKNKLGTIHYEKQDSKNEEVSIKKINLDTFMKKEVQNPVVFYNYEREEEFLKCLKALSKLLD